MASVGTENSRVQNDLFRPHFFVHKNNFDSIKRGFRNPFKKLRKMATVIFKTSHWNSTRYLKRVIQK